MKHIQAPWEFIEKYYNEDLTERTSVESRWSNKWLNEIRGKRVLSVGCGPNFYDDVQFFGCIPQKFVGIDINENNIEFLKKSDHQELNKWRNFLKRNNVKTDLVIGDIRRKRKQFVNSFDVIYSVGVLGMFNKKDTIHIFEILNSYLRKDGKLIDLDWAEPYLSKDKLMERKRYNWFWVNGLAAKDIKNIIEKTGFQILEYKEFPISKPKQYKWGKIYACIAQKGKD